MLEEYTNLKLHNFHMLDPRLEKDLRKPGLDRVKARSCSLVIKCLNKDLCHETFDKYFEYNDTKKGRDQFFYPILPFYSTF